MARRREPVEVRIDNLSHEGRGVGRVEGKTLFAHGALPGERVRARIEKRRGRFDEGSVIEVLEASPARIEPPCAAFGICGGCALQHAPEQVQLDHKQAVLAELLEHQAGVTPGRIAAPLRGPQFGYRRKARLGVKLVPRKGGVLVGFRERGKPYITDCETCEVLDPRVGRRLGALRALVGTLSAPDRVPQIEVSLGDETGALVFRHLDPLTADDRAHLAAFEADSDLDVYLQPGGIDTVAPLSATRRPLSYRVADVEIRFEPSDFTQVNAGINELMVARAIEWLDAGPEDDVLDLFCGLGNFSLPIARRARGLLGVEGDAGLVARAAMNAKANGIANARFEVADLADADAVAAIDATGVTRLLLDPPRSGAAEVLENLALGGVERIVYVSCNPVTFARDAGVLCGTLGFRLVETGIADMFPQTAHVESISLFARA